MELQEGRLGQVYTVYQQGHFGPYPQLDNIDLDTSYKAHCSMLTNAALQSVPRGYQKNYIPCWDEEYQQLYEHQIAATSSEGSEATANILIKRLDEKRQERWIETVESIDFTVVWNDYLLIFWPNVIFYYTRSWKPNANNQICWITKVSTHSKTLIQFCWKFIYFKDVYWWFLKIWICDKMRALFIFQIIDYAWISIMLFDLCWKW